MCQHGHRQQLVSHTDPLTPERQRASEWLTDCPNSFADTDKLAQAEKRFIPVSIPVSHWQLRHYISAPEKDSLFYASGAKVYHVNTVTKKRKHLVTLPFEARCTASGHGYVCVGGQEEGHFAVIKLQTPRPLNRSIDVDGPLPIEDYWTTPTPPPPAAADVKVERIGQEIVNSISIHQIKDEVAHLYDIVAVLTNNDRTVRIYSLAQGAEITCLELPFPMNHASISPDGQSLVAVGDSNQAFYYTRVLQQSAPQIPKPHNRLNMSAVSWVMANLVHLRTDVQSRDASQAPGYFTTAWSPSGHLVAVGSEDGHINVFDTSLFQYCADDEGEDAIIATVPSTRPGVAAHLHPGAVRTIIFSPEPWDLLIWAEDQGRVCIADLRTGLRTKQVIDLTPDDESLEKIPIQDLAANVATYDDDTDYLDQRDSASLIEHAATVADFASALVQARDRSRQNQALRQDFPSLAQSDTIDDDPRGLTAHEQQVLESLRTTRQREEARAQGILPRSVNYTSPSLFTSHNRSSSASNTPPAGASSSDSRPFGDVLVNHNDPYAAFPELSRTSQRSALAQNIRSQERLAWDNTLPPLHSIQEYLRLRDRERDASSLTNNPSTLEPPANHQTNGRRVSANRRSILQRASDARSRSEIPPPPHATRATLPSNSTPEPDEENPWRSISNAMNLARGPLFESPRSTVAPSAEAARTARVQDVIHRTEQLRRIAAQRERLRTIRREFDAGNDTAQSLYESVTSLRGFAQPAGTSEAEQYAEVLLTRRAGRDVNIGVRTAGLAMSQDGRTLWAACEDGIFEIDINVKGRMAFPSVEMR